MNSNKQLPQSKPAYKFYATLLDAFQYYLKSEYDTAFQEFIDKINRLPFSSEAAEKGTAFNELVDKIAEGKLSELENSGVVEYRVVRKVDVITYTHVDRNGTTWLFDFKPNIVHAFANEYVNAVPQIMTKGYLETSRGTVELYGYLDEIEQDMISDIKTTKSYEFPKFLFNFQHIVYPFTLAQEGVPVTMFRYHITDFSNIYKEDYIYNPEKDVQRLKSHCEHLIDFLEMNRHLITDRKIFGLDEVEVTQVPMIPVEFQNV